MSLNKNSRGILFLIILLTVINIVAVFTVYTRVKQSSAEKIPTADTTMKPFDGRKQFPHMMIKDVGLDDDQAGKFKESRMEQRGKIGPVFGQLKELNEQLVLEVMRENPDTVEVSRLCTQIGKLHGEIKLITVEHMREVWQIARPEQREKLTEFYLELLKGDASMSRKGEGHKHHRGKKY